MRRPFRNTPALRRTLSKWISQRKPARRRRPAKRTPVAAHLARIEAGSARVSNTLGTRVGAPLARAPGPRGPPGWPVRRRGASSGAVSSGGACWGGAGAAGSTRTSQPLESVRARGGAAAGRGGRSGGAAPRRGRAGRCRERTAPHEAITVARYGAEPSGQSSRRAAARRRGRVPRGAARRLRRAADARRARLGARPAQLPLARRRRSWSPASCSGEGGLEVLDLDPTSRFVQGLAVVALILILFRDGLEVEEEMLQKAWHLPLRKLALAMPLTCVLVALATHALTDLGWTESFLVGALLSPTDPGAVLRGGHQPARAAADPPLAQPRVRAERRPGAAGGAGLRGAPRRATSDFVWWEFVLQDVGFGLADRAGGGVPGVAADAAQARARARDQRAPEGALRARAWPSPPTGRRCCRRRATASSRCSWPRSRSASGGPTSASASRRAART